MQRIILIAAFIFSAAFVYAEDLIQKKSGERIYCRIDSVDTASLYITYTNNGKEPARLTIDKQEVEFFEYDYTENNEPKFGITHEKKTCNNPNCIITIGFLQGSSLILGANAEIKQSDHIGLQAGIGVFSVDAGLNFHLAPTIRSSCLSLQAHYEWFFTTRSFSIVPTFIYRSNSWFTAQVGYRHVVSGESISKESTIGSFINPIYLSVGAYISW